MKKIKEIAVLAAISLVCGVSAGHAEQRYIEEPTPQGQVSPASQKAATGPAQPYRNPNANTLASPASSTAVHIGTAGKAPLAQPLMSEAIVGEFSAAYRHQKSPRMAIFLNRALSDEVREWFTASRGIAMVQGETTSRARSAHGDDYTRTFKGPGGVAAYGQSHIEDPGRAAPADEGWMWGFEEGFLNAFLDAGATLVDRATIMRSAAAESGKQGDGFDLLAVKQVEMDALRDKADMFVEILIRRSPASTLGYDFKASAKEVDTGTIRANVSSRGWQYNLEGEAAKKVVATDTGYEFVEVTAQLPDINVISRDLALALMRSLAMNWSR